MNIKFLTLSTITSALLIAASPMVSTSMSTDNGGAKKAIDAYSDGAGVLIINQASATKFDNSAMNKLVFKFGDAAKVSNTTLKNQVNVLSPGATAIEKADATLKLELAKVVINPPVNGTECNDANPQTITDVWTDGLCGGNNVEGLSCDDQNALTFVDKYTSGICGGVTNGTTCSDNNPLTFADKYTSGVCAGITNGTTCNDLNIQTINDKYTSGICAGTNVEGLTCNDTFAASYIDKYHNGVCSGVFANNCNSIKSVEPASVDGYYQIDPDGTAGAASFQVYCDMTRDAGGWTLMSYNPATTTGDQQYYANFVTGDSRNVGINRFNGNFHFTIAKLEFFANPTNTQTAAFYKTLTQNNLAKWFVANGYETDATKICTDYALSQNCTTRPFDHDYANDGISSADGGTAMFWGTGLEKYGFAKVNYHPFHGADGTIGWCSTTGGLNANAWSDVAADGHWGNGLKIWMK